MAPPLRFIHASEFHLEATPTGLADVPDHLREIFLDAAYSAAEKVFDAVLSEDAEFLILSGDVVALDQAGPLALVFLFDQFQRLAERDIPIYWAGGQVDSPEERSLSLLLPPNVHVFPRKVAAEFIVNRNGHPRARLIGKGGRGRSTIQPSDFSHEDDGLFTIAVSYGRSEAAQLQKTPIDYWALGGRHRHETETAGAVKIHYAGTPQGRSPLADGPHGCTLVEADAARQTRLSPLAADVLRWCTETIQIDEGTDVRRLQQQLGDALQRRLLDHADQHLLVSFQIHGTGPLLGALRRGPLAEELARALRTQFGRRSPAAWTVGLHADVSEALPASWYEEDTMLGEFLRNVQRLQTDTSEGIELDRYLGDGPLVAELNEVLQVTDPERRQATLRRAAVLGADVLRGTAAAESSAAHAGLE